MLRLKLDAVRWEVWKSSREFPVDLRKPCKVDGISLVFKYEHAPLRRIIDHMHVQIIFHAFSSLSVICMRSNQHGLPSEVNTAMSVLVFVYRDQLYLIAALSGSAERCAGSVLALRKVSTKIASHH